MSASLVVQLALAPLTAWASDTPGFIQGVVGLLYRGSPYASNFYFNPPLAPFLQLPFFRALAYFLPPQGWLVLDPRIIPAEAGTGMVSAVVPDPLALLALKLPLILASLWVGAVLYVVLRGWGQDRPAALSVATAWWLNPVVIWSSAVHGEVDILAAACVVSTLLAFQRRWSPFVIGLFLGLGFFAKLYPLLLAPPMMALLIARARGTPDGSGGRQLLLVGLGILVPVLAFVAIIGSLFGPLLGVFMARPTPAVFGGLSILIIFNHQIVPLGSVADRVLTPGVGLTIQAGFVALLAIAELGAVAFVFWRARRRRPDEGSLPKWLPVVTLWLGASALLVYPVPQPEHLLAVLPILLLSATWLGAVCRRAYVVLSVAGWGLYLAFLSPFAFFYPAARLAGTPAILAVNSIVLSYHNNHWLPPTALWTAAGIVGGSTLVGLWFLCLWRLVPESWRAEVRSIVGSPSPAAILE